MERVSGNDIDVSGNDIEQRFRAALLASMKAKDPVATSALRSALAAIANAEAVAPGSVSPGAGDAHVAGSVAGLGATEATRRALSPQDVAAIVTAEAAERRTAAAQYEASGNGDRSARLRHEAEIIEAALAGG
jgi:hypothetical protein